MLINGEKYACEACVRGHRVSNCQHSNRPLQHINKKGRPVSQCAHCRSMRKSRAAHVKCDCGEKTSKCAHLQPTMDGHRETCCCNHGGRCTCAIKKEASPLGTVPESDSDESRNQLVMAKTPVRRRRAVTIHSSDLGGLTFDQHGHHKPSKHNRAAQKCGPYTLNRVHSASGVSGLGMGSDGLLFQASSADVARGCGPREQRQVKSETASPLMSSSSFGQLTSTANLPPLDLSHLEYPPYGHGHGHGHFDMFGGGRGISDAETPLFSASLSTTSVDWNTYELGESNGESFTPSSYSQTGTQSFNGLFDFGSGSEQLPHLANTTSNSGDVSEAEDFLPSGDGDLDGYGAGCGPFYRHPSIPNTAADLAGMDYGPFIKTEEGSNPLVGAISMVEEDPAFWLPNYNDGIATVGESPESLAPSAIGGFWDM